MVRRVCNQRFCLTLVGVGIAFFLVGQALAWQYNRPYATGLYGSTGEQPQSPYRWFNSVGEAQPRFHADGGRDSGGFRATQPIAMGIKWNDQALRWIRSNEGNVAITFHSSFNGDPGPFGCDNVWQALSWASTNLPSAGAWVLWRNCGRLFPNEVRIFSGYKYRLSTASTYFAQAWYRDTNTSADAKGQFNIDTYWVKPNGDGQENYHQSYCIATNSNRATTCPVN